MPYARVPARIKQMIPAKHGQDLFVNVVNSQLKSGKTEAVAFASAWAALQSAGYKKDPKTNVWERVEKPSSTMLQNKLDEWNEKYADKHGKITMGMLRDVYDRGVGAYRTNPESVRPNVTSPEQWAAARVNSFLEAARGAKAINHDKDIHDKISKSQPTASSVHVPSTEWEKSETYRAPAGARAAAARALRWKEKYGDKVKGGTQVGWTRANQLASGENLSRETVARMASFFARHKGNEAVDPKYKDEPWRDAGHVAWLLWGGDAGAAWAKSKMEQLRKRQIDDDSFTMPDEARARSLELGLEGEIHVHDREGQAVYMPGETHDAYLGKLEEIGRIEYEEMEEPERGLLERAIEAIMSAIMGNGDEIEKKYDVSFSKMDEEQRIVWGWASVSTEDGNLFVDSQGDTITPVEMEKMANDFMAYSRAAKSMHEGPKVGEFIHSFPMTNELMKAFGIHSDREGWIVALKVYDDDAWESVKNGTFTGLSIGGRAEKREALE